MQDPIVEEVHCIRQRMWDQAGGSLARLIESLRASEHRVAHRLVSSQEVQRLRSTPAPQANDMRPDRVAG